MMLKAYIDLIFTLNSQKTIRAFIVKISKRTLTRVLDLCYNESVILPLHHSIYIT
jgi:hypothetical protein